MLLGTTFLLTVESLRGRLLRKLATMLLGNEPQNSIGRVNATIPRVDGRSVAVDLVHLVEPLPATAIRSSPAVLDLCL